MSDKTSPSLMTPPTLDGLAATQLAHLRGSSEPLVIPHFTDALREAEERGEIHRLEIVVYIRGDEAERVDFGLFPSRRAAKRAALGELWRQMSARFPSRYSHAEGEIWIGGRPHRWLTDEFEFERYNAETIGDRLRRGEAVAV